ncbi:hypothetical protein UT300003_02070 [Clostridium sardiniense]
MKKLLISMILLSSLTVGGITANASVTSTTDEILSLMPNVTIEELNESITEASKSSNLTKDEITNQILSELKVQKELTKKEKDLLKTNNASPAATYTLGAPKYNGDIFYEPASTVFVEHGHVGTYWTADTVIESMPKIGVRSINRRNKQVQKGSKIFTLSGVSAATQNTASNWAHSRIGDKYSYNFATNRKTSHTGAKNCSKLVWSSYMTKANLDIDANGGLGVYPKDILNYSKSVVYKSY